MAKFQLTQGCAFDYLHSLAAESVDLVFTDYPYASLEKHRSVGTTTRLSNSSQSSNEWFGVIGNDRLPDLMAALYRVLKPNTHCYMMCDQETMFHLKPAGEQAGFKFWKGVVWDKVCMGMGYHYRARHEMVLFFEKGKRKLRNLGMPDVIAEKRIVKGYPTEKPQPLIERFIENSSLPGELVLDPFHGSGSTLAAALATGRNALGNDISDRAHQHAAARLQLLGESCNRLLKHEQQLALLG